MSVASKLFFVLSVLCIVISFVSAETEATSFDFHKWVNGAFQITTGTGVVTSSDITFDETNITVFNMTHTAEVASTIIGESYVNKTTDATLSQFNTVQIKFANNSTSKGSILSGVGEEDATELLAFDFHTLSNSMIVSKGLFGDADRTYEFVIVSSDKFLITVTDKKGNTTSYVGKKIPAVVHQTLWDKYKMWLMVIGMMGLNTFLQTKAKSIAAPAAAAAAEGAAPVVAAGDKKKEE